MGAPPCASSARQWDDLVKRLQPTFLVHAPDLHGHGRRRPCHGTREGGVRVCCSKCQHRWTIHA